VNLPNDAESVGGIAGFNLGIKRKRGMELREREFVAEA